MNREIGLLRSLLDRDFLEETIGEAGEIIDTLQQMLDLDQVRFLLCNLAALEDPDDIHALAELETEQARRGAGFLGMIPDCFPEDQELPEPTDLNGILACGLALTEIRDRNLALASRPEFKYQLAFREQPLPELEPPADPARISLTFNFSALGAVLDLFDQQQVSLARARQAAENPVFLDMLEHRRNLGYVPEPLPDREDLAWMIHTAAARDPLPQLWKWLNPFNLFNLADVYLQREKYRRLLDAVQEGEDDLLSYTAGVIAQYLPQDIPFQEEIALGVNWGIRSWATDHSLGTNLPQHKDDYQALLKTITHELFHKIQQMLCPVGSEAEEAGKKTFSAITSYPFSEEEDRVFYRTLSYLVLEGSATLVGGPEEDWQLEEHAGRGAAFLEDTHRLIYQQGAMEEAETVLSRGLQSNGPYYALGYWISRKLCEVHGKQKLGGLLQAGPLAFLAAYLTLEDPKAEKVGIAIPGPVREEIIRLDGIYRSLQ